MWPDLPYSSWRGTREALHLYTQIVGKYRLARTPWLNHSWHATLYVNARGLTTGLIPDGPKGVEIAFDLIAHELRGTASDGRSASFALGEMSVARFLEAFRRLLREFDCDPAFHDHPNEVPNPVAFAEDVTPRPYDAVAVTRFFETLVAVHRVLSRFRTSFIGKVSPVHLFWGSFDLAVTRFSGRPAPRHPGGVPGLPDEVTREAYSHEVSSCGFWPGDPRYEAAAFYSYAYPVPPGYAEARVQPAAATFDSNLGEFILPYDAVRRVADPEREIMAFLESTYRAAADLGHWDCSALECPTGVPLRPRPLER